MATLHPQMKAILDALKRAGEGQPTLPELTPAEARGRRQTEFAAYWTADAPPVSRIEEKVLPGPRGPIRVRIYDPGTVGTGPAILFIHGGGWVICDLDTHDGVARRLALNAGVKLVSIEYRLAPEFKFPAPLEDCVAAVRWIAEHGAAWGIDGTRLVVTGDSAGANLSLATLLALRDQGGPRLLGAALIYGAYAAVTDSASQRLYGGGDYFLTTAEMTWFWDHYVRGPEDRLNPLAAPLLADLRGLPPLYLTAAEFDPLLDDTVAMIEKLKAIGAPHEYSLWRGVTHASINLTRHLDPAHAELAEVADWLRRRLLS